MLSELLLVSDIDNLTFSEIVMWGIIIGVDFIFPFQFLCMSYLSSFHRKVPIWSMEGVGTGSAG
jgi:hypothetical protein